MDLNKQILSRRPIIIALIAILVVLIGGGGFWVYRLAWAPNFKPDKTVYVYIDDKRILMIFAGSWGFGELSPYR